MINPELNRRRRPHHRERGQVLLIIAMVFVALAAFIGLAIDLGILMVSQAHLRRGIDSAAIAAASQLREGTSAQKLGQYMAQYIRLNNIDVSTVRMSRCAVNGSLPDTDPHYTRIEQYTVQLVVGSEISGTVATYYQDDPDPAKVAVYQQFAVDARLCTDPPRKLMRVDADMDVRFSFLPIVGLSETTITANAVSEAAAIDLVIVVATGETMGSNTQSTPTWPTAGYGGTFDPTACNNAAGPEFAKQPNSYAEVGSSYAPKCRPLWDAKQAAKRLLRTLYDGYDRVSVVGYDFSARYYTDTTVVNPPLLTLNIGADATASTPSTGAYAMIDNLILKDNPAAPSIGTYSPLNVDCTIADPTAAACRTPNPIKSGMSSCSGCGIRVAANILRQLGRPEALWAIIFLSDGFANMSDIPDAVLGTGSDPILRAGIQTVTFPGDTQPNSNGLCQGAVVASPARPASGLWTRQQCVEGTDRNGDGIIANASPSTDPYETVQNTVVRYCGPFRSGPADCPPGSTYIGDTGITTTAGITIPIRVFAGVGLLTDTISSTVIPAGTYVFYSTYDYARDQVDFAALTVASSGERARGSNIAIYSIGLGQTVIYWGNDAAGERLLRYMAAVGDDGNRNSDPCAGEPAGTSCGNYYFAPDPSALTPVFEDIARRIFTRLSQ